METAANVFAVVWCLAGILFMHRMWKAYTMRIAVMKDDLDTYARLPSLGEMVFKFWRSWSSFVEDALEDTPEEESLSPDTKHSEQVIAPSRNQQEAVSGTLLNSQR